MLHNRPPNPKRYLDTKAASEYTGISYSTLEKGRIFGGDYPPFLKIGRKVLYDINTLDAWMASHQRTSTSEA